MPVVPQIVEKANTTYESCDVKISAVRVLFKLTSRDKYEAYDASWIISISTDDKVEEMTNQEKYLKTILTKQFKFHHISNNFVDRFRKQIKFNDNESSITWSQCGSTIPRLKHARLF